MNKGIYSLEEEIVLPCGIKGYGVNCADNCKDEEIIKDYKANPTSKNNAIERCYNSLMRTQ